MQVRDKGLTSRRVGEELVLLDLERSKYLAVEGSGVLLFEELQRGCSRAHLITALVNAYEVDDATAARDVDVFVDQLRAAGLLA